MQAFLIGLQFLTRIRVENQTIWTEEDFGKSVRFFPLVGAVLGCIYGAVAWLLCCQLPQWGIFPPRSLSLVILLILPVVLTGGIHCDGFMDTMDGVFSGRSPERILEIMKDSRVGSFGVVSFVLLMITQYSALSDVPASELPWAVFVMPVIARFMMVLAITEYPYARKQGMGKAFSMYASRPVLGWVALYSVLLIAIGGYSALLALAFSYLFTRYFCGYVTRLIGGLTGDVYGAVCTLCELVVLLSFILGSYLLGRGIICI